jgi:hypothetical protein
LLLAHDILVTNPPYSGEHKQKLLDYISGTAAPFALLLPAYTATKSYWKTFVESQDARWLPAQVVSGGSNTGSSSSSFASGAVACKAAGGEAASSVMYVLPPNSYQYDHPEGTGRCPAALYY